MSEAPTIDHDRAVELLNAILCGSSERVDSLSKVEYDAFSDMQDRFEAGASASPKQLLWIQRVSVRLGLIEEQSQNLWSSRAPAEQARIRGRDVPTPEVLLTRPMSPPGREKKP